jgi:hypothetical protein
MLLTAGFVLALAGGYWLARTAAPKRVKAPETVAVRPLKSASAAIEVDPLFRRGERPAFQSDDAAMAAGALAGQRTLAFKDRAALEAFLAKAGSKVRVMDRLDRLNVLRIGFLNYAELAALLDGSEEIGMIFSVTLPENESVAAQPGAVPLGSGLLQWLGITGDNSTWGAGVKIAILDTGVSAHPAFGGSLSWIGSTTDLHGHGTPVASMILGDTALLPGVAPGSSVLSVQIADADGYSDSFKMAQGILAALDAGVSIINISMGSSSDSPVLRAAIEQAIAAGVIVVAPTGNSGIDQVSYPAAYKGVIAVGGVDADGTSLAFSNRGNSVATAAPGYEINAAYLDGSAAAVSGTSFSSPIVAGLIAATMSQTGKSAADSWALILANLNEAGDPGFDTSYGNGLPDMSRVLSAGRKGIYDAAVASQQISYSGQSASMAITIQNRGTETLVNTGLQVNTSGSVRYFNATTLAPGAIQTFNVPVAANRGSVSVDSSVTVSSGQRDEKPSNNRRVETYTTPSGK